MAKQLNVNLAFTADTSQAKAALQDLQNNLSKITSAPATNFTGKWTKEMQQASTAAMELKTHLQNATNIKTGTLDFTKLNQSIQKSNMSISQYGQSLLKLGPAGQQAFMSLANAISQAEIPIRRSNAALQNMMTTLKNTARWQLSSSMLHGFMSAVQSAYGYAQDLNESLNNIRIVTGQNIDQMAKFAEKANQAARALSTTTTDYTDASLIYYQQGLSDSEVEKRTAVTIKMANAAGQSAQVVSDQLTAVWNNFYDGSKSLEYYADVMTALGAATASSTDEIAGGLEKFAAIADTIGLSYEYAASALATITANTRQSEDVVGTALKTIFARIQGLNLGETLEDGTTLNKYSEALQKVGISIFDQNGELKKMDDILNEMGAKWETLNTAQQTALAQTVAGVRQYNQLISLMDNWDSGDSDSMMANLETSYNATGTLQEQADIYAESWEAAQDRVRAAAESIFSSLMDEDFFIGALNNIEKILTGVDSFIDSLGGLKGVLSTVGVLLTKTFSTQMAESLRNMAHNVYMSTAGGRQAAVNEKYAELDNMQYQMSLGYGGTGSISGEAASRQYSQQIAMQKELIANSDKMSQSEIANAQKLLDLRRQIGEQVIKAAEREEQSKDRLANSKQKAYMEMGMAKGDAGVTPADIARFDAISASMKKISMESHALEGAFSRFGASVQQNGNAGEKEMAELSLAVRMVGKELDMSDDEITQYMNAFKTGGEEAAKAYEKLMGLLNAKQGRNQASMQGMGVDKKTTQEIVDSYGQIRDAVSRKAEAERRAKMAQEEYKKSIQSAKGVVKDWANSLVSGAQAVMSFASILNSATSMIETLTNPDATGWEKFMAVLQSGSMIMMMTVSMFNSLAMAQKNWQKGTLKNAASTLIEAAATSLSTKANEQNARAQMKKAAGHNKDANAALKDAAATKVEGQVTEKNNKSLGKSFKSLGKSIGDYAKAFKTQIAGGVIVAASIALIIGTITAATNQYNEAANNAEKAAEAAEQLANQYQDVKTNYESFISTADGYKNVIEGMKSLTKGTAEYNEQLLKANEYAMDLINKYDLIGKYSVQGGLIVFDEGALEAAQMQQLDALGKAQANSYAGQVAASHFTGQSNQTNLNRDINSASDNGWNAANTGVTTVAGGLAGAGLAVGGAMLAGATIGSSVPVIGTIIGAVVGLIAGIVTTAVVGAQSQAETDAINKLTEYVAENGDGIFAARTWQEFDKMLTEAKIDIKDKDLIKSLYANRDAVRELTLAEVARLEREEANFEAGFAAYNMNNSQYTGLEVGQGYMNEKASNYRDEHIDTVRGEVAGLSDEEFWAQYLSRVYGQQDVDAANKSGENVRIVDAGGDTVTVEKKNEGGVWETYGNEEGLDKDVAQEQLVNSILLEQASKAMDFEELDRYTTALEKAGLNIKEDAALMDSILAQFADDGTIDLSGFTYSDLAKINVDALDGPMQAAVSEAISSYEAGMSAKAKEIANSDWYKSLTPDEQDLVWTIETDEHTTLESVKAALEASQAYIDSHLLSTSIQVRDKAVDAYESGNFTELKELYTSENSPYDMPWEDFLKLDPTDAINYLTGTGDVIVEALASNEDAIRENSEALEQSEADRERAEVAAYGEDRTAEDGVGGSEQVYYDAQARTEDAATRVSGTEFHNTQMQNMWDLIGWSPDDDLDTSGITVKYHAPEGVSMDYAEGMHGFESFAQTLASMLPAIEQFLGPNSEFYGQLQTYTDLISREQAARDSGDTELADSLFAEANTYFTDVLGPVLLDILAAQNPHVNRNVIWDQMVSEFTGNGEYHNSILSGNDVAVGEVDRVIANRILSALPFMPTQYDAEYAQAVADEEEAKTTHEANVASAEGETGTYTDLKAQEEQLHIDKHVNAQAQKADIEKYGLDPEVYEEAKRAIAAANKELEGQEGVLHRLARAQLRAERGMETIEGAQEDWKQVIEDSGREGSAYLEVITDMRDAYADVFDLDPAQAQMLTAEFLSDAENLNLMTEALKGNDEAWDQWKLNVANQILDGAAISGNVREALDGVMGTIATYDFEANGIEIGAELNDTPFWDTLAQMEIGSAEAANAITDSLSSMGVDAELEEHTVTVPPGATTTTKDGYYEYIDNSDPTNPIPRTIPINSTATQTEEGTTYTWYTIKGAKYNGKGVSPPPGGGGKKKGGGGGGGSKPKKTSESRKKKSDVVDRYKEVNDRIEETTRLYEKNATAADRLWGPKRIAMLKSNVKLLEQENKQLKEKYELSKKYLQEDATALQKAAQEAGISFNIDNATGNILNYTDQMTKLFEEREALLNSFGAEMDEKEQERLEEFDKKLEKVKEAYEAYEQTLDEKKDLEQEQLEKLAAIQQEYYDILSEELEIKLTVNDTDLKVLEYYLGKVKDDFFSMAEAAAIMFKDSNSTGYGKSQLSVYLKEMQDYQTQYDKLLHDYTTINPETGETYINQAQFIEGLQEIQDGLYENLDAMKELDNTMLHYYGDTLAAAAEELEKYTSLMDHHVDVLDHYANLLDLLGRSEDWESMKTVLSAQVEVAENAAEVSKANYEMLAEEAKNKKAAWDAAKNDDSLSDYEKSVIEQQWLDAQNAANEAQSQMLEDAEAWAEALKSLLETELAELADILEKSLSGEFGSLDNMISSMERANSLQEEYLTTTNQIYETNKLMRTAQQEIDKSTNSVAKRRLKQFIDETEQLQNQNKLSQFELEIQQAKYDLLLAEIALEEAQKSKSTVRLQRDSEGNFGYVYTADQNEIAQAQQDLEDAQNALYNIGLEGANKYAESYAQTIQEMNDAVTELTEQWQNGEISSKEEYQERMLALEKYYGEKLMQYSDLHSKALVVDSRIADEAWTKDFAHMTTQTQLWMKNVDSYVSGVERAMGRYQTGIDKIERETGMDLKSLKDKTEDIKKENEALAKSITDPENGLIKAIKDEITAVGALTLEYAKMWKEMQKARQEAELLAQSIGKTIDNESDDDPNNDLNPTNQNPPPSNPTPPPSDPTPPPSNTESYKTGHLTWTGNGGSRIWTDSAGKTYTAGSAEGKAIQAAFNRAYSKNGGYKGDYFLGWNRLDADVLHKKYGLSTGGYTGDWPGSYGKLAFLHQKELVLNAKDTENLLATMDILDKIISTIDLYSSSAQLGGLLNTPRYSALNNGDTLEQNVHIEASFPNVNDHNEIEEALNNLINRASQYAYRQ